MPEPKLPLFLSRLIEVMLKQAVLADAAAEILERHPEKAAQVAAHLRGAAKDVKEFVQVLQSDQP